MFLSFQQKVCGRIFAYSRRLCRESYCLKGGNAMKKEEEKKPITWEAADPKLPVVQSGHFENHVAHQNKI